MVAQSTEHGRWGQRVLCLLLLLVIVAWLGFVAWLVSLLLRLVYPLLTSA